MSLYYILRLRRPKPDTHYTIIFISFFLSSGFGCFFFSFSSSAFACAMVSWSFSSHSSRVLAYTINCTMKYRMDLPDYCVGEFVTVFWMLLNSALLLKAVIHFLNIMPGYLVEWCIISSHSPFFLSTKGAKIYNLDVTPPEPQSWTELPNVRAYYELFMGHRSEFK